MTFPCTCRLCERHLEFEKWLDTLPEEARTKAAEYYDELNACEADLEYLNAIRSGDFPDSVMILRQWLMRARAKETPASE